MHYFWISRQLLTKATEYKSYNELICCRHYWLFIMNSLCTKFCKLISWQKVCTKVGIQASLERSDLLQMIDLSTLSGFIYSLLTSTICYPRNMSAKQVYKPQSIRYFVSSSLIIIVSREYRLFITVATVFQIINLMQFTLNYS